jgi:hypothetical protein
VDSGKAAWASVWVAIVTLAAIGVSHYVATREEAATLRAHVVRLRSDADALSDRIAVLEKQDSRFTAIETQLHSMQLLLGEVRTDVKSLGSRRRDRD